MHFFKKEAFFLKKLIKATLSFSQPTEETVAIYLRLLDTQTFGHILMQVPIDHTKPTKATLQENTHLIWGYGI